MKAAWEWNAMDGVRDGVEEGSEGGIGFYCLSSGFTL